MPTALPAQTSRRSSCPATDGRPGENNGARPDRSERRRYLFIATSFIKVLRQPLESALATSVAVVHEPAAMDRPPIMQGLLQRIEREARMRRTGGPPAHDAAGGGGGKQRQQK